MVLVGTTTPSLCVEFGFTTLKRTFAREIDASSASLSWSSSREGSSKTFHQAARGQGYIFRIGGGNDKQEG